MVLMRVALLLIFLGFISLSTGCVGPAPVLEYSLAKTAFDSAKSTGAPKYAKGTYFQARSLFRQAKKNYKDREYGDALKAFEKSRELFEKAENITRYKKFKSGEDF